MPAFLTDNTSKGLGQSTSDSNPASPHQSFPLIVMLPTLMTTTVEARSDQGIMLGLNGSLSCIYMQTIKTYLFLVSNYCNKQR